MSGLLVVVVFVPIGLFLKSRSVSGSHPFKARSTRISITDSKLAKIEKGTIRKSLMLDGELRAVGFRTVFASASQEAKITYMPPEGTIVKAGERLVELDSSSVLNRIKDFEERIVAAENEVLRANSQNEATLRDLDVETSRFWLAHEEAKVKAGVPAGLLPRRDYQERQLTLDKTRTEYESHLAKVEQKKKEQAADLELKLLEKSKLEVQLNKAKNELNGMALTAPAEGMVIYAEHWFERRKIQIGDVVWGGFPLVRLPDLKEMEVIAQVNEVDGPRISIGQKAAIVLDSYPDIEIGGTVKEIAQTAIKAGWLAKSKIFKVVISMDKTLTDIMKPGMSARVSVIAGELVEQVLVPRSAIKFEKEGPRVLKVEGENGREIVVEVITSDATHYAIADHGLLAPGDRVACNW